jgi:cytosine/adenosine deaminase-related metal-dependent hydrolase
VIIPGLVNAHAHLDLTHIGPRPHDPEEGFVTWVDMVRARRLTTAEEIAESVRQGIELSRRGGTVAVGDIAGAPAGRPSLVPWEAMSESGMMGVSFLEFFAIGKGAERGMAAVAEVVGKRRSDGATEGRSARIGLQPHAPNTVSLAGYRRAVELAWEHGLPLATHLAETWEEREFIGEAKGMQRALLERLGIWDDSMLEEIGRGRHPVQHLTEVLEAAPFVAAHVNDADDAAIRTLARTGTTVAYCPRASAYFGAHRRFGPHRYREMMAAGVRVALGSDSLVNLDTPERISVLDEMRLLYQRDGAGANALLEMGTVSGAFALGLDTGWFRLGERPGPIAGLVSVETSGGEGGPLDRVMRSRAEPELLLDRNYCCQTRMEPI